MEFAGDLDCETLHLVLPGFLLAMFNRIGGLNFRPAYIVRIWPTRSDASLELMQAAMTGRETPQARPRAILEGT